VQIYFVLKKNRRRGRGDVLNGFRLKNPLSRCCTNSVCLNKNKNNNVFRNRFGRRKEPCFCVRIITGKRCFRAIIITEKLLCVKKTVAEICGTLNVSFCMTSSIVYYFSFVQDFELMQGAN
jgi:hypothetical protein